MRQMTRWMTVVWLPLWLAFLVGCPAGSPPATNGGTGTGAATNKETGGNAGVKRVIFLNNTDSPFWDACRAGLFEGEKEFDLPSAKLKVAWESNNGTAQGQIEKLRQFGSQSDIAAIAISVIQADNVAIIDEMKNLQKKGVKIITVDGDVNRVTFPDARPVYIGTDNVVGGRVLGTAAKELLKAKGIEKGGYVQFAGFTDNDNARSRMDGVKEAMGEGFVEKDRMPDETDRTKARDNVRNALNHEGLVSLFGIWSYNAPAIAEVVTEKKVRDKLIVATFDAEAGAIEDMTNGKIDVMVVQDPYGMGREAARLLKAMVTGDDATVKEMVPKLGEKDGDIFTTGLKVVIPDKDSPLKAEMFDPKVVNFMTLSQFKDWLKKYDLSSS